MSRLWDEPRFQAVFRDYVSAGTFNEEKDYYPRYRSRYRDVLKLYASLAPSTPQMVLDVGGGQLGLLCKLLWEDQAEAADIGGPHLDYLRHQGVQAFNWNLCSSAQPVQNRYDVVFFSEVIEHLPIPGHIPLERLRVTLKSDGILICTTPNLYRPRNIIYLLLGIKIFDYFRFPTEGGLGHVVEYSHDHLGWQLEHAGFSDVQVKFHQVRHSPNNLFFRVLYWLGRPIFRIERFRDNLFAVAHSP